MISQVPMSTAERIQMLAAAALQSRSETFTAPRPVGFMLSFEQLRALEFGGQPEPEMLAAEECAVQPRCEAETGAVEATTGRHWREVMAGSTGFRNRRRSRSRELAA